MYLVSYDIASDRVRRKVSKALENYGRRIQYSVFECDVDEKTFQQMYAEVLKETGELTDGSVRFYYLCKSCASKMRMTGIAAPSVFSSGEDVIVI